MHRGKLFAVLSIAIIASSYAHLLLKRGGFDDAWFLDDRLYLYSTGFVFTKNGQLNTAIDRVVQHLAAGSPGDEKIARIKFRHGYRYNYSLHSLAIAAVAATLDMPGTDYGTRLFTVYVLGIALGHLICLAAVAYALWSARNTSGPAIVFLTVVSSLAGLWLFGNQGLNWRFLNKEGIEFIGRVALFLGAPGREFDFYGITPRNAATLLVFGIVVLRWIDRFSSAYWLIFLASLVHATYGVLLLFMFLGIDALLRPRVLRNWRAIVPAAATVLSFVPRNGGWESFGAGSMSTLGTAFAASSVIALASNLGERLTNQIPLFSQLRQLPFPQAELIVLVIGTIAVLCFATALNASSSALTGKYVANELASRPLVLMRIPLLMNALFLFFPRLIRHVDRIFLPASALAAVLIVGVIGYKTFPPTRTWKTDAEMQSLIEERILGAEIGRSSASDADEAIWYYAICCQLDDRCDALDRLLALDPATP